MEMVTNSFCTWLRKSASFLRAKCQRSVSAVQFRYGLLGEDLYFVGVHGAKIIPCPSLNHSIHA